MQQGYFSRSWEAFRSTEGWFAKICILALIAFIPILGPIVVSGYLLGWARDAAWGMDNPLPRKVFGNEDGRLYRRGLFVWIVSLVMGLAVFVVVFVCMSLFGLAAGVFSTLFDGAYAAGFLAIPAAIGSFGIGAVSLVVSFAAQFFIWVGCMRMSIYDTLSAGFQVGQIWSMIRRDPRRPLEDISLRTRRIAFDRHRAGRNMDGAGFRRNDCRDAFCRGGRSFRHGGVWPGRLCHHGSHCGHSAVSGRCVRLYGARGCSAGFGVPFVGLLDRSAQCCGMGLPI